MGYLEEDDGPQLIFVDDEDVALWVRVGPVFINGNQQEEPVVWVELQPRYYKSGLEGPVMFRKEEWDALNDAVQERFRDTVE